MKRKYLILFSLSGLILALDQLSKEWMRLKLPVDGMGRSGRALDVIPAFFTLQLSRNNGFAFGLLQKAPASLQEVFFIGVPVFALVLIILIFIKLQDNQMLTSVALTTILGGAVGNLIDRLQYGYVLDFLQLHLRDGFRFPAFNIADCSIIIGVALMFFNTLRQERAAI